MDLYFATSLKMKKLFCLQVETTNQSGFSVQFLNYVELFSNATKFCHLAKFLL